MNDVDWMDLGLQCPVLMLPELSPYELARARFDTRDLVDDALITTTWYLIWSARDYAASGLACRGQLPRCSLIATEHDLEVWEVQQALDQLERLGALTIFEPCTTYPEGSYLLEIGELPARSDVLVFPAVDRPAEDQVLSVDVVPDIAPRRPLTAQTRRTPWYLQLITSVRLWAKGGRS